MTPSGPNAPPPAPFRWGGLIAGLATALVIVVALCDRGLRFSGPFWRAAMLQGEMSYSLYLYHNAALLLCYVGIIHWSLVGGQRLALIYAVGVPLAYLFAWTSYRLVERPGIEYGKRFAQSRNAARAQAIHWE